MGTDRNLKGNNVSTSNLFSFFKGKLVAGDPQEGPWAGKGSSVLAGRDQPAAQTGPNTCWWLVVFFIFFFFPSRGETRKMAANREHRGGRQHSPTPLPLPLARTSSSQRWNRLTEDRGQPRAGPPGTAQPPGVPERTGNRRSPLATRPYNYRLSPAHGSAARRALSPAEAARGLATGGPRTLPGSRPTARAPSEGRRRRPLPRRCGGETPPWPRRGRRLFRRRLRVLRGSASRRAGPGGASCGSEGRPGRPAGAR